MSGIKALIFDLGNVLIEWNPLRVFNDTYFPDKSKRDFFLQNICTMDWNERQDEGRSIVEATQLLIEEYPEWEEAIRDYYGRWTEMLGGPISGSVEIFRQLKQEGKCKLYALTNWQAGLFDIALVRYNFLHWFDGRVVSGEERMRKPAPEFFQILLDRYNLNPAEALFIDDNERNVKAAKVMGIKSILFTTPEVLRKELESVGILAGTN